jgi:hypothetical protein
MEYFTSFSGFFGTPCRTFQFLETECLHVLPHKLAITASWGTLLLIFFVQRKGGKTFQFLQTECRYSTTVANRYVQYWNSSERYCVLFGSETCEAPMQQDSGIYIMQLNVSQRKSCIFVLLSTASKFLADKLLLYKKNDGYGFHKENTCD